MMSNYRAMLIHLPYTSGYIYNRVTTAAGDTLLVVYPSSDYRFGPNMSSYFIISSLVTYQSGS